MLKELGPSKERQRDRYIGKKERERERKREREKERREPDAIFVAMYGLNLN